MAKLDQFKDHFLLLCEGGFIAVNQANEDAATKLFSAAELLNPKNSMAKLGRGYMHMMKLELNQACKFFSEVLAIEPDNEMAKAFMGLSYTLTATDVSKGEKALEDMAQKSDDPMIKQLAVTALEFVDKFVKKSPTPIEAPEKKNKEKQE